MNLLRYLWQNLAAIGFVLGPRQSAAYLWSLTRNVKRVISCKSLRPADVAFIDGHSDLNVRTLGGEIRLKEPDIGLVRELYGRHIYFPEPVFIPPKGSKVIDLGANVGLFSLLCAKLGANVLAVEAQIGFVSMARQNFVINNVQDRTKLVHCMVGASTGVFATEDQRKEASHWGEEPPVLSMDELLHMFIEDRDQMIHLLKVDIEGSEFGLLKNDLSWLHNVIHIAMEVHPEFGNVRDLHERIEGAGFKCKLVPSWHEKGIPQHYPGFLFAYRNC